MLVESNLNWQDEQWDITDQLKIDLGGVFFGDDQSFLIAENILEFFIDLLVVLFSEKVMIIKT